MSENIGEIWGSLRSDAIQNWRLAIEETLFPALEARGIKVNSTTIIDPVPGNEYLIIWFCSSGDWYLEIHAHSATALSVTATKNEKTITWPTLPPSVYDRKNYTVAYLIAWLDEWIV
jgi:hypothetical protein